MDSDYNVERAGYRRSPRVIVDFRFLGIGIESIPPPLSFPYTLHLSFSMLVERSPLSMSAREQRGKIASVNFNLARYTAMKGNFADPIDQ